MRFSHEPPTLASVGEEPIAAWALETYATHRDKKVSIQPPVHSLDPALPVVGFERNEPFRRLLGDTNLDLPLAHLDRGVIYHWKGRTLARPSSVEAWIEAGSEWFSGPGFRDFWESVWNLSVAAWNFADEYGFEPVENPTAYPYLQSSAWQGFKWNKVLFAKASDYVSAFEIEPQGEFRTFIDSQIRFEFGRGLEAVPMGLAAMVLNAPSIAYTVERETGSPTQPMVSVDSRMGGKAWRIPIQASSGLKIGTPHQVFLENEFEGADAGVAVLTLGNDSKGYLYYRSSTGNPAGLDQALDHCLGKDWGWIEPDGLVSLPGMDSEVGGNTNLTGTSPEWPWLGPVRAYLEARRPLL